MDYSVNSESSESKSVKIVTQIGESQQNTRRPRVRLPDIGVKIFSGDPTLWPEYFDYYNIAVHQNTDLSDIERFTYLKGYLHGDAKRCIQGLSLTEANYKEAVELLKKRFGNKRLIISRHMEALLELDKVTSSAMIKELRGLYDKIMVNIRALKAYKITPEQFGPVLAPVILKKLPTDIKLEINRRLEELLDILHAEIETQETCAWTQDDINSKPKILKRDYRTTTEALHVGGTKILKCAFCQEIGSHYSDKCPVVSDVYTHLELVRKYRLCFKCLGTKHNAKKCHSLTKCFYCKQSNHNSALCKRGKSRDAIAMNNVSKDNMIMSKQTQDQQKSEGRETFTKTTLIAANENPVFLQTIKVMVEDVHGQNNVKANIIFDGGSQKTYLSQR